MRRLDLVGKRFGRWVVIKSAEAQKGRSRWLVRCDCGTEKVLTGPTLNSPKGGRSCGCSPRSARAANGMARWVGGRQAIEYTMWKNAKGRAKKNNMEFNIQPGDVIIPEFCPLLGIPLTHGVGFMHDNSPQLDRRDTLRGYTKDNIWVISLKANRSKSNLSYEQAVMLVRNWGAAL